MEVEVKIRLPDRAAYDKLHELLATYKTASHAQENYFFDGDQQELESQRAVMRLRFYNGNGKATITVKGKQILQDGIGRASEVEEDVPDAAAARAWLDTPGQMLAASPLLTKLNEKWGIKKLLCMGGFKNQREVYQWEGLELELDETAYDWGKLYEIECETTDPEAVRDKLEKFLTSNGISYSYSKTSKFANFVNKTLLCEKLEGYQQPLAYCQGPTPELCAAVESWHIMFCCLSDCKRYVTCTCQAITIGKSD